MYLQIKIFMKIYEDMLGLIIDMSGKFPFPYLLTQPPILEEAINVIFRATVHTSHSPASKASKFGPCQYPQLC